MKKLLICTIVACCMAGCGTKKQKENLSAINEAAVKEVINELCERYSTEKDRIARAVPQVAQLWRTEDGSIDEFKAFCLDEFVADSAERWRLAQRIQENQESLWGCYNKISVDLKLPIHVSGPEPLKVDERFAGFDPYAHLDEDMYNLKTAFVTVLNFPCYTLKEKDELGKNWSRQEWAYARLGDLYTSRIPAEVNQTLAAQLADADNYISNYNIMMGHLRTNEGKALFGDMALITHWGLRDELKSHYNEDESGLEKQRMIYQVMLRIIDQSIPGCVINNDAYEWNPVENTVWKDGKQVNFEREPDTRYQYFLDNFHAEQQVDKYVPMYNNYIDRAFENDMEVSYAEIEDLFRTFCGSDVVKDVAKVIETQLGRKLEPFDIWYDGFKARSSINEDALSQKTKALYPSKEAFAAKGMPHILHQIGFNDEVTKFICSKITVDPSRGAGHAWESNMKCDNARLRTRIGADGMDYKGYNIAVHEFGHNVEQTLTLHNVDNYIMKGVPNTAFTEALAFVFQTRDLELLGIHNTDANQESMLTLDIFWGCYEIMGVSLVDMYSWKWLYDHPNATKEELKAQVMEIAKNVWNEFYAPVLGGENSTILAIYSHMIDSPLYLPNYPYGHIIEFQLEQQLKGKNIADEILRIYPVGRLTPQCWMQHAVGGPVSIEPLLNAAKEAIANM